MYESSVAPVLDILGRGMWCGTLDGAKTSLYLDDDIYPTSSKRLRSRLPLFLQ